MKKQDASAKLEMLESLFPSESTLEREEELERAGRSALPKSRRQATEKAVAEGLRRAQIEHIAVVYESEIKLREEVETLGLCLRKQREQAESDRLAIEELREKNDELTARDASSSEHVARLEKQNRDLQIQAGEAKGAVELLEKKVDDLNEKLNAESRLRSEALKKIQDESHRKLAQVSDEKWELELLVEELKKAKVESEGRFEQAFSDAENYAQSYHAVVAETSKLRIELANKDGELAQLRQKCEYELRIRDAQMSQSNPTDVLREARSQFHQELASIKNEAQQTIGSLKSEQARLEAELARARESAAAFKHENLQLQVDLEKAQLDHEKALCAKESEIDRQLKAKDIKILDLEAARASLERDYKKAAEAEAGLGRRVTEIENAFRVQEEQTRSEWLLKHNEYQQTLAARDLRIQELKALCDTLERECSRLLEIEQKIKADYEKLEVRFRATEDQLRAELAFKQNDYQQALAARDLRIQELKGQCDFLERDRARLSESEQRLKTDSEKLESRYRSMEDTLRADLNRCQSEFSAMNIQLAVAREQLAALRQERGELVVELEGAERTVSELREAVLARTSELQLEKENAARELLDCKARAHNEINEYRKRSDSTESHLHEARARIQHLEAKLERMSREIAEGESRVAVLSREVGLSSRAMADERARSKDQGARLELRENQLKVYSNALGKDKAELQQLAKRLVKEVRMLAATHPLKDYVAATEFELSKVEIQLKKTPTLAKDRVQYEEYLAKLVEQRDFLKSVLGNSQRQYEKQALELEKLISGTAFTPVPPPPPLRLQTSQVGKAIAGSTQSEAQTPAGQGDHRVEPRWEKPFDVIA